MVINELRVFREVDNRARDGKLIDGLQDEIKILRAELRRLREWITHLEGQARPQEGATPAMPAVRL